MSGSMRGPADSSVIRRGGRAATDPAAFVPVLLYHGITDTPSSPMAPFTVRPQVFADHLDLLVSNGFEPVTMAEFVAARAAGTVLNRRLAVITFDDGYADFASEALPRLLERGLPATLYLTTGWLEGGTSASRAKPADPFLSWSDLEAIRGAGIELGSHSHTHPQLDTLSRRMIRDELHRSKAMLEDALSAEVPSMAYPHGYSDPRVRRIVREVGYESGAAVQNALASPDCDALRVPRLMLGPGDSVAELARLLATPPPRGARAMVRGGLRIGWRAYRRTRAVITRRPGRAW